MRTSKIIGYIDRNGEIHEGMVPVFVGRKITSPYGDRWMQVNQNFLLEFSARKDVTGENFRVFLYLNARLDFENIIQVPQIEIANDLGMKYQNVHRSIKKLEALGVILRGPRIGRASSWRLNKNVAWKGKVIHLKREIEA